MQHTKTVFYLCLGRVVALDWSMDKVLLEYWTNQRHSFRPDLPFMPYRHKNGEAYIEEMPFVYLKVILRHVKLDATTGCLSPEVQEALRAYAVEKARFKEFADFPGMQLPCPWVSDAKLAATPSEQAPEQVPMEIAEGESSPNNDNAGAGQGAAGGAVGLDLLCSVIEAAAMDEEEDDRAARACWTLRQRPVFRTVAVEGPPSY